MSSTIYDDNFKWPREEVERAKLFVPEDGDTEKFQSDQRICVFRFDEDRNLLLVVSDTDDAEIIRDVIDPSDIVGASVEIKLMSFSSDENMTKPVSSIIVNKNSDDSYSQMREQGKGSPISSTSPVCNEPKSEVLADTQAIAVLSLFVYPKRKTGMKESILRFCGAERSKLTPSKAGIIFQEQIHQKQNNVGHRYALHRQFTVAPAEDLTDLSILVNAIRQLSRPKSTNPPDVDERLLVIVNPFSGRKRGVNIYDTVVLPMLEQAGLSHDCLVTTHAKHAEERMSKQSSTSDFRDVSEYSGIVLVGGDGIIHEVMQGIRSRGDSEEVLGKIKLGMIGAGTSNGYSASLAHASKEHYSPLDSTFMIVKGMTSWVDLSRYETKSKSYTSFLTFSWAMIADIDIESECIRWAGFIRMDIWGVVRVLFLRKYRAKFSYLPPTKDKKATVMPALTESLPSSQGWITCEDEFIIFWASLVSHAGEQMFHAPPCKLNDGMFNIMIVRGNVSRLRLALILLSMEHGGHFGMRGVEFIECSAYRLEPTTPGSFNVLDGEVVESGPIQCSVMPSSTRAFCNPQYSSCANN
jgi:sphingosine kinase